MKAIETTYRGTRYRSRTEARWAVFFEAIGIEAIHEGEGFDLEGVRYLCDFWLPASKVWFEVKGIDPNSTEIDKAHRLSVQSGRQVVIAVGHPPISEESHCLMVFDGGSSQAAWLGDWGRQNVFIVDGGYGIVATLKGAPSALGGFPTSEAIIAASRAAQAERFGV